MKKVAEIMQAVSAEIEIPGTKAVREPIKRQHPPASAAQRGQSLMQDIKREMPGFAPTVIFDIGANVGERSKEYASAFADSRVYCFEPVATTFTELERNVESMPNCQCFQFGFGDVAGTVDMLSNLSHSNRSYVMRDGDAAMEDSSSTRIIQARLETIDRFCAQAGIRHIDLLKIDAEGFDMKVLQGARHMLVQGSIKFIVVEAGMYPGNTHHVPFMDLWNYLGGFDFFLFGIYDQCREWVKDLPYLRRADLAFIRQ